MLCVVKRFIAIISVLVFLAAAGATAYVWHEIASTPSVAASDD